MSFMNKAKNILGPQTGTAPAVLACSINDFLQFHTKLGIASNEKFVSAETAIVMRELALMEFGSDAWLLAFNFAKKIVATIEDFNMWLQICKTIQLSLHTSYVPDKLKQIQPLITMLIENWDTLVATPAGIQNYMDYYKTQESAPIHPLLFIFKTFGLNITGINIADPTFLLNSLSHYLKQNNISTSGSSSAVEAAAAPAPTHTPLFEPEPEEPAIVPTILSPCPTPPPTPTAIFDTPPTLTEITAKDMPSLSESESEDDDEDEDGEAAATEVGWLPPLGELMKTTSQ